MGFNTNCCSFYIKRTIQYVGELTLLPDSSEKYCYNNKNKNKIKNKNKNIAHLACHHSGYFSVCDVGIKFS